MSSTYTDTLISEKIVKIVRERQRIPNVKASAAAYSIGNKKTKSLLIDSGKKKKDLSQSNRKTIKKINQSQWSNKRISGGANNPAVRKTGILPRTDSECKFHEPGIRFLIKKDTIVSSHEVKISPPDLKKELRRKCDFFPKFVDERKIKDQVTQTRYRESSAQTLPYQPPVVAEEHELFSLPSVLAGDTPPGLHEVEVLERARKRWSFRDALKTNFKLLLVDAKEKAMKSQYKPILEAFEWEQWLQREEDIQECQMMRLEIVIKMFDKREKEMHSGSKSRIEKACAEIEKRRQAALKKNEKQYKRGIRQLEITRSAKSRKWRRQSPIEALGDSCSEFYTPLLRHGVDPARRNFVPKSEHKAFDMRIDALEKKVDLSHLICPFRKLTEWSKPVEKVREYEQNFCNENNLQKLFDSLKELGNRRRRDKEPPKCLRIRQKPKKNREGSNFKMLNMGDLYDKYDKSLSRIPSKVTSRFDKLFKNVTIEKTHDTRNNDLYNLMHLFEGSSIGWVMQFLGDELARLMEQRRLHYFCMLAQKERFLREAQEGGLRQKENKLRIVYEDIFQHCQQINNSVACKYIESVLTTDIRNAIDRKTVDEVTEIAKQIDKDIERWLESFKSIQNPLTYVPLRLMLKDMVCPDFDAALSRHETTLVVHHVVEDVLMPRVWNELDPFDIGTTLTSDLIDRLIDNDLYLFSTDSESDTPQKMSWKEAQAIIRKLIRQAVPGNRWKEENERIVLENFNDLFDDLFLDIIFEMENPPHTEFIDLRPFLSHGIIRETDDIREKEVPSKKLDDVDPDKKIIQKKYLNLEKKSKVELVTGELVNLDSLINAESPTSADGTLIKVDSYLKIPVDLFSDQDIFSIKSSLSINEASDFRYSKGRLGSDVPAVLNIITPGIDNSKDDLLNIIFDDIVEETKSEVAVGLNSKPPYSELIQQEENISTNTTNEISMSYNKDEEVDLISIENTEIESSEMAPVTTAEAPAIVIQKPEKSTDDNENQQINTSDTSINVPTIKTSKRSTN